jgi:hypothetical protein
VNYHNGTVRSAVEPYHIVEIAVAEPYHNSEVGDVAAGVVAGCPGSFGQRWKPAKLQLSLRLEKGTQSYTLVFFYELKKLEYQQIYIFGFWF